MSNTNPVDPEAKTDQRQTGPMRAVAEAETPKWDKALKVIYTLVPVVLFIVWIVQLFSKDNEGVSILGFKKADENGLLWVTAAAIVTICLFGLKRVWSLVDAFRASQDGIETVRGGMETVEDRIASIRDRVGDVRDHGFNVIERLSAMDERLASISSNLNEVVADRQSVNTGADRAYVSINEKDLIEGLASIMRGTKEARRAVWVDVIAITGLNAARALAKVLDGFKDETSPASELPPVKVRITLMGSPGSISTKAIMSHLSGRDRIANRNNVDVELFLRPPASRVTIGVHGTRIQVAGADRKETRAIFLGLVAPTPLDNSDDWSVGTHNSPYWLFKYPGLSKISEGRAKQLEWVEACFSGWWDYSRAVTRDQKSIHWPESASR